MTKNLQEASKAIKGAATPESKVAFLDRAFDLFTQETTKAAAAYWNLQAKFEELNIELQGTNERLKTKVSELKIATNCLYTIIGQMSQGLLFIDLSGIITTYNHAAEQILGCSVEKTLFQPFWTLFPDDLFGFSLRSALQTKNPPKETYASIKDQDDHIHEVEVNTSLILHENAQGFVVLLREITELRRLQTLAARNDRLKELGEVAAMVAHEIRNPLGGIKGFASLLQRDLKDHPEMAKMAGYIVEGTDSLNRLVGTILNYARPLQLKLESTDVGALIQDLVKHVQADPNIHPAIAFSIELPSPPLIAPVDSTTIKSGILNLMVNALQSMPEGGCLTVTLGKEGNFATIQVRDTGKGVSRENMSKLFLPFFTTKIDGNGFGLAETHKIVQAHGGSIEAKSKLGQGTVFTIKLPLQIGIKNEH